MIKLWIDDDIDSSNGIGSAVLEKDPEIKEPPLYQVVLINDDYSPMEFVVYVLQTVFNHTHEKSTEIMMAVHSKGADGVGAAAETKEKEFIAQSKIVNEKPVAVLYIFVDAGAGNRGEVFVCIGP